MIVFDKHEIRESLSLEDIFGLLHEWGGDPEYAVFGILCSTICHNAPGEGSRKLYFYENTGLFKCYTGCENSTFDIFELTMKIANIQWHKEYDLNDAVRWIASKFGISGTYEDGPDDEELEDWKYLANYERIQEIELKGTEVVLKEYDDVILSRFNYDIKSVLGCARGLAKRHWTRRKLVIILVVTKSLSLTLIKIIVLSVCVEELCARKRESVSASIDQ